MPQQDLSVKSVWYELWQGNPLLYLALNLSTTVNNALVSLLLVAVLSTAYDFLRTWLVHRTRQTCNYTLVDDACETPLPNPGPLSLLARTSRGPRSTVYAKASFHATLFVGVQAILTLVVVQIARVLASTFATDRHLRKQCSRLLQRGLECSAAKRYHDVLNVATAIGLSCFIRGFQLHVDLPNRQSQNGNYSPGFLSLQDTCRRMAQRVLAAPIAVVVLHLRVSRDELWKHAKLLAMQAVVSVGIFICGNVLCLLAAFPDVQGTIHALEVSGLTGKTEV